MFVAPDQNEIAHWEPDPNYKTQPNYILKTPVLLRCYPPLGPDTTIAPGGQETFRILELIHGSTDRERRGLTQRRMYRALAPRTQENPILMHVRRAEPEAVMLAIDQCADVGSEMVIVAFGSWFDIEQVVTSVKVKQAEQAEPSQPRALEQFAGTSAPPASRD
jgi:hypothetical protein